MVAKRTFKTPFEVVINQNRYLNEYIYLKLLKILYDRERFIATCLFHEREL